MVAHRRLLGLIWNLIGVYFYLVTVGVVGRHAGSEQTLADAVPHWVTGTFAICVFGGTLGCLGLLLLRRWSRPVLVVSLIAIVVQHAWAFTTRNAGAAHADPVMSALVIVIALFLAWLAHDSVKKGYLS